MITIHQRQSSTMQVREAGPGEFVAAQAFYESVGYTVPIGMTDLVLLATSADLVIGVVRLCNEHGCLVLRGMQISPAAQRQGVGMAMLKELTKLIGKRECWCLPYTHLENFYSQVGFRKVIVDEAPEFLQNRLAAYLNHGADNIIMKREDLDNH